MSIEWLRERASSLRRQIEATQLRQEIHRLEIVRDELHWQQIPTQLNLVPEDEATAMRQEILHLEESWDEMDWPQDTTQQPPQLRNNPALALERAGKAAGKTKSGKSAKNKNWQTSLDKKLELSWQQRKVRSWH